MKRAAIPFLLLGLAAVAGLAAGRTHTEKLSPEPTTSSNGSVRVTAQLEHTHLLAGQPGEAYARVVLEGKDAPAAQERLPVSLTVVIDRSGSMSGGKIEHARTAALQALDELERGDRVSVIAFGSQSQPLLGAFTVGDGDLTRARARIHQLTANGGTNMVAALSDATRAAHAMFGDGRVNRVLLLSDGQPNTQDGLVHLVKGLARKGVHTTTLGVGRDYNEDLMSQLADAGLGNYYFVEHAAQLAGIFEQELRSLATVVAKEAVITIDTREGVEVLEVIGWEASRGTRTTAIPVGDIFAGKKADVLLKVRVPARDVGQASLVNVSVGYHDALDGEAKRARLPLAASFVTDRAVAAASIVPEVAQKREQVLTAAALEKASAAYARGDEEDARRIFVQQKQRVQAFAASAGEGFAPAAAEMEASIDELEDAVADKKDASVASKRAKARARAYKR